MFRQKMTGAGPIGFGALLHDHMHDHVHGAMHRHGFGRRFGRRGGRGPGRGNIRFEILALLAEKPSHGYDLMLELEKRSGGFRPSPGSIYPALQMLEEGGFIAGHDVDGKRVFEITDAGRASLAEHAERGGFARDEEHDAERDIFIGGATSLRALMEAAKQVARLGDPEMAKSAIAILDKARRDIYKLLAEGE
jgi:DNA-binding PadR family transcriptional regulator